MRKGILAAAAAAAAALALTFGLASCGKDEENKEEETSTGTTLSFTTDVAPIVKTSCALSGCHGKTGAASGRKVYEDNEANYLADKASIKAQLESKAMPQAPGTISDADKQKLIDFANQ